MSSITTGVGLISGIDTADLIDQLMAVEARPRQLVEQRVATLQQQKTAFQTVNAGLLSLKMTGSSFTDSSVFGAKTATSSNTSLLTATASEDAATGTYNFTVDKLVSTHQMISRGFADADTTALGVDTTLRFEPAQAKLTRTVELAELNGHAGIRRGILRITDRSGQTANIDLSRAVTLDNVIHAINNETTISVTASVDGDRLKLTDHTGSTASNLIVANVGTTDTATSLGIAGHSGGTNEITGSQINTLSTHTPLSALNDGNGVRITSGANDLVITDHGNRTIEVNLDGALTVGDVIDKINEAAAAAGSSVTAAIGDDRLSLKLTDGEAYSGTTLAIADGNARDDLGFVLPDLAHGGELSGERLLATMGSKLLRNLNGGAGFTALTGEVNPDIWDPNATPGVLDEQTLIADLFAGSGLNTDPTPGMADMAVWTQDGSGPMGVDLDGLTTVGELIDAVAAQTGGKVAVTITGDTLTFTDQTVDAGSDFRFGNGDSLWGSTSTVASDLGIAGIWGSGTVDSVDVDPAKGGPAVVAGGSPGPISVTNRAATNTEIDLSTARSVQDVIDLINQAGAGITASINSAGNGLLITDTSGSTAGNLVIEDVGDSDLADVLGIDTGAGGVAASTLDGGDVDMQYLSTATRMDNLNGGRGVAAGKFIITNSQGVRATVDLTQGNEVTLADVISEINSRGIDVTASINATGDGLLLTDNAGGALAMTVEEAGATTAADLNIFNTASGTGADNRIDGTFERTVTINADHTLQDVVDAINSADIGTSATLINDGSQVNPYRISLTSDLSGRLGAFLVDDGALDLGAATLVEATDAVVFFGSSDPAEAVALTSPTNSLADTIDGVTIDLLGTSSDPVQITVAQNNETIVSAVKSFVTRFNEAITQINKYDKYDSETEQRGILLGDPTLAAIRNQLYNVVNRRYADVSGQFQYLSQVGVTIGSGAKLTFNETKFRNALATDAAAIEQLFTLKTETANRDEQLADGVTIPASGTTVSAFGVGAALEDMLDGLTDSIDGRLTRTTESIDDQIELANDRIDSLNVLLKARRARLEQQFTAMEQTLAQLQAQQNSLASLQNLVLQSDR